MVVGAGACVVCGVERVVDVVRGGEVACVRAGAALTGVGESTVARGAGAGTAVVSGGTIVSGG